MVSRGGGFQVAAVDGFLSILADGARPSSVLPIGQFSAARDQAQNAFGRMHSVFVFEESAGHSHLS
jgi:hypothetical protein